jgi:hypothetical protein
MNLCLEVGGHRHGEYLLTALSYTGLKNKITILDICVVCLSRTVYPGDFSIGVHGLELPWTLSTKSAHVHHSATQAPYIINLILMSQFCKILIAHPNEGCEENSDRRRRIIMFDEIEILIEL